MGFFSSIGSALGSVFGGPFGGAIGTAAGGLLGSSQEQKYAQANAATAIQANRENYQNRHQWQVQDLRKAGLNPILSANSGASVAASPMAGSPNVAGNVASATQAAQLSSLLKRQKAETNTMDTQGALNTHKSNTERAVQKNQKAQADLARMQAAAMAGSVAQAKQDADIYNSKFGKAARIIEKIVPMAASSVGAGAGLIGAKNLGKEVISQSTKRGNTTTTRTQRRNK